MDPFNQKKTLQYSMSVHDILLPGEDPSDLENLLDQFELDHKPATATEVVMVHNLVKFHWLMNRAILQQQKAYTTQDHKLLDQMTRQVTSNNRNFLSTLNSLKAAQRARRIAQAEDDDEFDRPKEIIFPKYPGLGRDGYKLVPGVNDHYEDIEDEDDEDKEPPRIFERPPGRLA